MSATAFAKVETSDSQGPLQGFLAMIPGIFLLAAIGFLGKLTEQSIAAYGKAHHLHLPNIEYVLWAIIYGLIVANTVGVPAIFRPGVATYEFWLKLGIIFLGVRFLMGDVLKLGGASLVFVAIELTVSIVLMTFLGRWLGLNPKLTSLDLLSAASRQSLRRKVPLKPMMKMFPTPSARYWPWAHSAFSRFRPLATR
jgi:uncharacterized membrane protein YadS